MNWRSVDVTLTHIDIERGGEISVYVFVKEGFPIDHDKALKRYRFDVEQAHHTIQIEVPDVEFALKAHHDEDRSGTVTKNWTGFIPAEGFAFSSGARMRFGPPSFSKAKTSWPESGALALKMRYP